jgi:hypothetical protein
MQPTAQAAVADNAETAARLPCGEVAVAALAAPAGSIGLPVSATAVTISPMNW